MLLRQNKQIQRRKKFNKKKAEQMTYKTPYNQQKSNSSAYTNTNKETKI